MSSTRFGAVMGLVLVALPTATGCFGGELARAKQVPGGVPPGPPPSFQGTIGGRAFVARSAVMLPPEVWNNGITVQTLLVFERPMDCGRADDIDRLRAQLVPGEHVVEVRFPAPWPHYPGTVWRGAIGTNVQDGRNEIEIDFLERGSNGGPSGSGAAGEVRVYVAAPGGGVVSLRASSDPSDPAFRGTAPEAMRGRLWGSVSGDVPFIACRR